MEKRTSIFASFPENTFLENIAIDALGAIYVTSLLEGIVYRFGRDGSRTAFAHIDGKPAGILALSDGSFLVNGWDAAGKPTIYRILPDGETSVADQPVNARFFNGMTPLNDRQVVICDAYLGCLWCHDLVDNRTSIWLEHPLLTKVDMEQFYMPSVNGIKRFGNAIYVSNTERRLLLRIPLDGERPSDVEILIPDIILDDFAFDEAGNLFGATHVLNGVVKITPDLQTTVIAEEQDGLAGSTAVAFGRSDDDKDQIYVTTNGGMTTPVNGQIQPARIVRINVK
jgi:hypothetical protein